MSPSSFDRSIKEQILSDMRGGARTRHVLSRYGLSLHDFKELLKEMIREGSFTKDEYKAWKARRYGTAPEAEKSLEGAATASPASQGASPIQTYVLHEPERNHSWALELFSTRRETIPGANFKVNLYGKRYSFVVEKLLYRGPVTLLADGAAAQSYMQDRRQEAMDYIAKHGWSAYLEDRAFQANFGEDTDSDQSQAQLIVVRCRNDTFLAALHTPTPAINFYVSSSLKTILERLAKNIDMSALRIKDQGPS
ncbi:MAG: hypothetical protein FJ118_13320 [Deltaproteobacteria bacterium]|nr:hypothetical protein [Deltaproteobacteria bacterium]